MANKDSINRRQFLKKATAVAGAVSFPYVVPSAVLGLCGKVSPSNRIAMGCIGMGGRGTGNMHGFMSADDIQIVAVCDVETEGVGYRRGITAGREPARQAVESYYAKKKPTGVYKGCTAYVDFRELLTREAIDTVSIATPDHWHGLVSVASAEAGKDIYCEKPLANTITEGRAVCDAVERYGRILQTGSHERSRDTVRFACELVRNGRIGKLHTIRVNMPNSDAHHVTIIEDPGPFPTMPIPEGFDYNMWLGATPWADYTKRRCHFWWRFILDYGGGEMTDRGAHIIDIAQLGNNTDGTGPVEIVASGEAPEGGLYNAFMKYQFECKYANGVQLVGSSKGTRGLKFEGSDGWIFIHIHGGHLEAEPKSLLKETIGPNEIHLGRSPNHHRGFLNAVETRIGPFAPAEFGHRTASICHLINIAMLTGKKLKWDPYREQVTNDSEANGMLGRPMRSPWHL